MSFGSLSSAAIRALNAGAKAGGFYHDTGEGSISPHHRAGGGDLVWEIGSGYFGCRTPGGRFDLERLVDKVAATPQVRAIELKLSQGAKPGMGGMLPGAKVTPEIAEIRGIPVGEDCKSPSAHSAFHDVDSSVLAFEIASRAAMREGLRKAGAKLLEPIMKVEVVTPEEYTGSIIGDLTSRRGMVRGQDSRGNANVIDAFVPLANMFGYINNLRSMSSGRAVFTMQFDHYEAVPQNISDEIQKKYA